MACTSEFNETSTTQNQRIVAAVRGLREGGLSLVAAQSIVAISVNESNVVWSVDRSQQVITHASGKRDVFPWRADKCRPRRQVIGFEHALCNGHPCFKPVSAPVEAALIQRGYAFRGAGGHLYSTNDFGPIGKAVFMELVMVYRDVKALHNISIGPTQMFLGQGPLQRGVEAEMPGLAGWPTSWNDLYNMYFTCDPVAYVKRFRYLQASWYPAQDPNNRAACITWLTKQVGWPAGAALYYDGGSPQTGVTYQSYKSNLLRVISLTGGM